MAKLQVEAAGVPVSELTPKREAFAQGVASGKSQADAYRAAFNAGNMKDSSIHVNASKLMADAKVSQRVASLRKPIAEKAQMTLESHLAALKSLCDMAAAVNQYGAAITAEIARGKASGVAVEKLEVTNKNYSFVVKRSGTEARQ